MSWRRLLLLCDQIGDDPGSSLWRALAGDRAPWTLQAQLLAVVANSTAQLVWAKTEDAQRRSPRHRPEPILPPWLTPAEDEVQRFGTTTMTIEETREWLGW